MTVGRPAGQKGTNRLPMADDGAQSNCGNPFLKAIGL